MSRRWASDALHAKGYYRSKSVGIILHAGRSRKAMNVILLNTPTTTSPANKAGFHLPQRVDCTDQLAIKHADSVSILL